MSVRESLAGRTRLVHEALHEHELFASIFGSDAQEADMRQILRAFRAFFVKIEKTRATAQVWPELTMMPELSALTTDLGEHSAAASSEPEFERLNRLALLGALYVAHGASFGRSTMAKAMPDLAKGSTFLSLRPDASRWRALTTRLETEGGSEAAFEDICHGAFLAFEEFGRLASARKSQTEAVPV